MQLAPLLENVLARYGPTFRPVGVEPLGSAGGFSGAELWRLTTADGRQLCLRKWPPEHPTPERLTFIHSVLRHVERQLEQDSRWIPIPFKTRFGQSFFSHDGALWELAPWLPGTADYHAHPNPTRLKTTLAVLARFHVAASTFPRPRELPKTSPGIIERSELVQDLLAQGCGKIAMAPYTPDWPELNVRRRRLLSLFPRLATRILNELSSAASLQVPLQPCLRDIWHDHVLFHGDQVSGLVDFGAMRIESVAGDIARLLGSLVGDDKAAWRMGLAAYEAVRPLSSAESRLVPIFDRSTVLLSGMNWLTWICVEQRVFADRPRIIVRLDETLDRLEHLNS